jgi:hypothetical protein
MHDTGEEPYLADASPALSDGSTEEADSECDEDISFTFTCFPRLPAELRMRIWEFACFIPRNVCIDIDEVLMTKLNDQDSQWATEIVAWRSDSDIPAVLQVCQESRSEARKHYSLELGTEYTKYINTGTNLTTHPWQHRNSGYIPVRTHRRTVRAYTITVDPEIWINWDVDTLYMPRAELLLDAEKLEEVAAIFARKGLKSLALNFPKW